MTDNNATSEKQFNWDIKQRIFAHLEHFLF